MADIIDPTQTASQGWIWNPGANDFVWNGSGAPTSPKPSSNLGGAPVGQTQPAAAPTTNQDVIPVSGTTQPPTGSILSGNGDTSGQFAPINMAPFQGPTPQALPGLPGYNQAPKFSYGDFVAPTYEAARSDPGYQFSER